MKAFLSAGILLAASILCASASAQRQPAQGPAVSTASPPAHPSAPVDLNWTPPQFAQLSAEASTRSSFRLDRSTLSIAAGLLPQSDAETRQALAKLDGVSTHFLSFGSTGGPDEALVADLRQAYHQRGWKHLVTNTTSPTPNSNTKLPLRNGTTDLWVLMDGTNLRGAVALVENPRNLTLITLAGNISPVDLLHLRGHFGIPRFDDEQLNSARDR